jgi:3-isopropylmalate dehydrogenase
MNEAELSIAVLPGDGIGPDVIAATLAVLEAVQARLGGVRLRCTEHQAGASLYRRTGVALPDATLSAIASADAVLFGAMGLPSVRRPDGTEVAPQLELREQFGLYAGIRPARLLPGVPSPLADPRAAAIDLVIIRESTEGLFAGRKTGRVEDDARAVDELVITRATSERLFDMAFALAARREAQGRPCRVDCVDKANVLRSMAFFRRIFDERAAAHPGFATGHRYVDAAALDLVRKPWELGILVTENMFGDILSDLAAALVGGMGMAPSADIGQTMAVFQPAHGSAPDIAGQGIANPIAAILSAAMMLDWLGMRHGVERCLEAAMLIEGAVDKALGDGMARPVELGGRDGTEAVARAVIEALS